MEPFSSNAFALAGPALRIQRIAGTQATAAAPPNFQAGDAGNARRFRAKGPGSHVSGVAVAGAAAIWCGSRASGRRHAAAAAGPRRVLLRAKGNKKKGGGEDAPMAAVKPSFDFAYWAEHPEEVQKNADNRKFKCDVAEVVRLYNEHRAAAFDLTGVQKRRNDNAASMKGKLEPEVREKLIEEGKQIKAEIGELEAKVDELYEKMCSLAIAVPNLSHPETPIGDEENAKTLRIQGEPRTDENAGFKLKDHLEIGEVLDMFDFESGGKVSGQKFLYFKNGAALLEMALVQWSLHEAVKAGFTPHITPDLVREPVIGFCGFNPRDGEATQIYKVADSDLCLTGTAEIPMCGKFINETLIATQDLPQKLVAYGHAFRTEAGSSGSENRGIYRLHQFSKVELFGLTKGDTEASNKMLEEIRGLEEELFTKLGLCFRVLDMPTEELGAPAYRKYDIEAWMPGMEKWGEISSCSNCTDFQARRLNLRHKETYSQKGGLEYVHTLNGTACAVPRMIIAILETFQNEDGTVTIPEVLRPYMMGMDVLKPPK